ncbi:hypothetical protein [Sphingomonas sp.]|uniref:hypothetical protein n=1 Tax=Sphingomonas sp. TaxID=28214 RepID=UPI0035B3B5B7
MQSPATYQAAIQGAIARRRADYELALYGAWNAERFHRVERLRPFNHYAKAMRTSSAPRTPQTSQERLAVFTAMAGAGVALKITRIP